LKKTAKKDQIEQAFIKFKKLSNGFSELSQKMNIQIQASESKRVRSNSIYDPEKYSIQTKEKNRIGKRKAKPNKNNQMDQDSIKVRS
jgi:3-methyladenine DNA glycosylase Mpg